jgi:hypothetical protein
MSLAQRVIEAAQKLSNSDRKVIGAANASIAVLKNMLNNPNLSPEKKKQLKDSIGKFQDRKKSIRAKYKNKNESAVDLKKELLKYAKEDVGIAKKEGAMSVADTKRGVLSISYNKESNTFDVSAHSLGKMATDVLKNAPEKEVIDLLVNSYQVVEESYSEHIHELHDKAEKIEGIKELIKKWETSLKNAEEKLKKAREGDHSSIDFWFDRVKMYHEEIKNEKEFLAKVQKMDDDGPSKKNESAEDPLVKKYSIRFESQLYGATEPEFQKFVDSLKLDKLDPEQAKNQKEALKKAWELLNEDDSEKAAGCDNYDDSSDTCQDISESAKDGIFKLYGKTYKTKVFKSDDEANKFLEDNEEYGVIGTKGEDGTDSYEVHVALTDDIGESLKLTKKISTVAESISEASELTLDSFKKQLKKWFDYCEKNKLDIQVRGQWIDNVASLTPLDYKIEWDGNYVDWDKLKQILTNEGSSTYRLEGTDADYEPQLILYATFKNGKLTETDAEDGDEKDLKI